MLNRVTINGTDYPMSQIGTQTWTTLNYNGAGGVNYNNVTGNLTGSGKLYTYAEAIAVQLPTGWRLPTQTDYNKLVSFIGGSTDANGNGTASGTIAGKLVDPSWSYAYGDDSSNFEAFPFGYYDSTTSAFIGFDSTGTGGGALFWASTTVPKNSMDYGFSISNYLINNTRTLVASLNYYMPTDRCSLRFVKDN